MYYRMLILGILGKLHTSHYICIIYNVYVRCREYFCIRIREVLNPYINQSPLNNK